MILIFVSVTTILVLSFLKVVDFGFLKVRGLIKKVDQ